MTLSGEFFWGLSLSWRAWAMDGYTVDDIDSLSKT